MTTPPTYPGSHVQLPLDAWLYEGKPVLGCEVCQDAAQDMHAARRAHDANARFEAARKIRQHPHGVDK